MGYIKRKIAQFFGRNYKFFPNVKYNSFIPVHYQRLKAFNPDIIYSHDLSTLPVSAKVASEIGCKLVFDSHELEAHRNPPLNALQRRQVKAVEKKYLPKCDYVTTVCKSIENILVSEYNLNNTGLIYNAPALEGGQSHPRWERFSGGNFRVDAGLSHNDFALLYVGLITVNRGIEFVLRAIEHLPENIKLIALGPGQNEMKRELQQYADSLDLSQRFIILDPVNPPEVYKYIQEADAAIIPITPITLSYEVALPNKFFESGFSGNPIISADLIEIKKLVDEYRLGVTYDALDEQDCANAILRVYENYDDYIPKSADVEAFKKRFCWENQEDFILSLLDNLTAQETKSDG